MDILVGYTGFVGTNIALKHKFGLLCNSKNIEEAFGTNPDLLVYSGVPAEMFLANSNPEADRAVTENAANNIRKINPKRLVLISTIAVLDNPIGVNEDVAIDSSKLTAYGLNRLNLERAAADIVADCHVIRLPALFGKGIKKNFIYDMIHFFPAMLNKQKYDELSPKEPIISKSYFLQDDGFYKLSVSDENKAELKSAFERVGFSALNFTDSRSVFQYYNLSYMFEHIKAVIEHKIPIFHAASEPVSAREVYEYVFGDAFVNELNRPPFNYDYKTKYADLFGGKNGYIFEAEQLLNDIKQFVEHNKSIRKA